jgi:hypothetical protein
MKNMKTIATLTCAIAVCANLAQGQPEPDRSVFPVTDMTDHSVGRVICAIEQTGQMVGVFETPDLAKAAAGEPPAYHVLTSKRTNSFNFNAGETVYELITPEGAVYTMFSLSLKIDPKNTIENLPTLGERLKKLPEGWKFRSRKLDKEMILSCTADSEPPNTIVLDELVGNYQYNAESSKQAKP